MDIRAVVVTALLGAVAVVAGGFVTQRVFLVVDQQDDDASGGVESAGSVLRGGAWIGGLERLAIFAGLVAGWPDAIAIVLAVKGLGRYPELRHREASAVAERFIIGTFVSVLWACACAGLALWLR